MLALQPVQDLWQTLDNIGSVPSEQVESGNKHFGHLWTIVRPWRKIASKKRPALCLCLAVTWNMPSSEVHSNTGHTLDIASAALENIKQKQTPAARSYVKFLKASGWQQNMQKQEPLKASVYEIVLQAGIATLSIILLFGLLN